MSNVSIQDYLSILESTFNANVPWRIKILKAALDGRSIQISKRTKEEWLDLKYPKDHSYDFDNFLYRIKPDMEVYYQYVVMSDEGRVFIPDELFKSKEDCRKEYPDYKVIKCLDETGVEVTL